MLTFISLLFFALATLIFLRFTIAKDRGHREPKSALYAALGFGILALVLSGLAEAFLVNDKIMGSIESSETIAASAPELLVAAFTIGLIEESAKCIPLALFLYKKRYFDEITDGVIYFGIVALTFGMIENILYAFIYGGGTGIARAIIGLYAHVGFAVFFGVALAYHKILKRPFWIVPASLFVGITAHTLYDFYAFSNDSIGVLGLFMLSMLLNILVFVIFRRAQRSDEARGQSTIGENKFCRHCGAPNPDRLLYCSQCGNLS